jgi:hypothetical protein
MITDGCKGLLALALTRAKEVAKANAIANADFITIFDLRTWGGTVQDSRDKHHRSG